MVARERSRRRIGHPDKPSSLILAPNDVWSADYKGQFKTGNGRYCYPLTVADGFSRYLLGMSPDFSVTDLPGRSLHSAYTSDRMPVALRSNSTAQRFPLGCVACEA